MRRVAIVALCPPICLMALGLGCSDAGDADTDVSVPADIVADEADAPAVPTVGTCCRDDSDCGADLVCAWAQGTEWRASPRVGACVEPDPGVGKCWRDSDCTPGTRCALQWTPYIPWDCKSPDASGTCVQVLGEGACCGGEVGICDVGLGCRSLSATADRVCVGSPTVVPTSCWSDDDCGTLWRCDGAATCSCGAACDPSTQHPGRCVPGPDAPCCVDETPCGLGETCRTMGVWGAICAPPLETGQCYDDTDCAADEVCNHPAVGCWQPVYGTVHAVSCMKRVERGGCCAENLIWSGPAICAVGLECLHWICLDRADGDCLEDTDCPVGQSCRGPHKEGIWCTDWTWGSASPGHCE